MSKTYSAGIVTAYGAAKRAGYQGTYEDFCRQQAGYAESAATVEQAKNTAVSAANTATTKATEATTAATAAQTAKTQTEAAASQALTDIAAARSGAISAVQTEGQTQTANARAQAQAAATSANAASTKASEASASATSAGLSATNAATSATSAAQSASDAQDVLDSIPADYSDLSNDVGQLKADLNDLKRVSDNWEGGDDYTEDGPNKCVSSIDGSIYTEPSGYPKVIKGISVVPGMTLTLKLGAVPYAGGRGAAFYDKNGTFVPGSGIKYVVDTLEYTVEIPETAESFAFTWFTVYSTGYELYIGNKNETYIAINNTNNSLNELSEFVDGLTEKTNNLVSDLYGIEIDGYRNKIQSIGTVKSNYVLGISVSTDVHFESPLDGWEYKRAHCIPGYTYTLTGTAGTYIPMYLVLDANNNVLDRGDVATSGVETQTATIEAPAGAEAIVVNGRANQTIINGEILQFEQIGCGVRTFQNVWLVGTGKLKTEVNLYKSSNGAVRYGAITYDGSTFKAAGDDVTPVNFTGAGYVGANHGYLFAYVATKASHGLTVSDIGKTYTVDGNTWVLIKVNNNTQFTVVCKDDSKWYGMKTATPPNTFDFGTPIAVTSMASVNQLYPSVKNINVDVLENSNEHFIVAESYDIINPKTGIAAIIAGVGNNDNNSFATLAEIVATVRNVYDFNPYGACVITQNLKITDADAKVSFYGGTQSGAFGSSDYYSVPLTTYKNFQQAGGSQVEFVYTTWDDAQIPPIIYCQMNNSGAYATGMMVQGILMDNRRSFIKSGNGGFISSARKMYPYAIQPGPYTEIGTYNLVSFRLPMHSFDMSTSVRFAGCCKVGKDDYFFAYNDSTVSDTIKIGKSLVGKKIETIIANNAVCHNALVSTGIDVQITGEGYLLLKLTD